MFDILIHKVLRVPYTLHYIDRLSPKRPRATIIFIHGIGNSARSWEKVTERLPDDVRAISVDLLGFGQSPRPNWAQYNAKTQARSVLATLLKLRMTGKVIIVGHSLGSLVAIELAKRYPLLARSLLLCSPPLYTNTPSTKDVAHNTERLLRRIYGSVASRPSDFVQISRFAMRYGLAMPGFNVTNENIDTYVAALRSAIINQTAFEDIASLRVPTHIIRATLDPFVIPQNIKAAAASNSHVSVSTILAGHDVRGRYVDVVAKQIAHMLPPPSL